MRDFLWCVRYGVCYWCGGHDTRVFFIAPECHLVTHMDWTKSLLKELIEQFLAERRAKK